MEPDMPIEEDKLAALEVARHEAEAHEVVRYQRYAAEDAATAEVRKREDDLHAGGEKVREAMKAALEADIKKRDAEEAVMSPAAIEELMARIAMLEGKQNKQKKAAEDQARASDHPQADTPAT
jgi:hypothetical protein